MGRLREKLGQLLVLWTDSLPGRVLARYQNRRGPLLASGLAYGLLFAFFALLWTIFSIFGVFVSGNKAFRDYLISAVGDFLPGLAQDFLKPSLVDRISGTLTWTGLVTLVIFWWTITSWMDALRKAVGAMFDSDGDDLALIKAKAHDTLAILLVAILLVLSTAAGAVSGGLVRWFLGLIHISSSSLAGSFLVDLAGLGSGLLLNFLLFLVILCIVAHVKVGRYTLMGAGLGALSVSLMQLLATRLLTGASRNPLLAPFAAIIGVLIWFNLVSQVMVICSSFIAECEQGGEEPQNRATA
ncbi:hypothetical protein CRD60_01810 [Bifidobacterium aemilianum]|uniref:Uncharacterized protein n=1 Tax=Bifidobacterium aemilianum TaxID=2493120 RepID=A0A366KA32_9BIFI|nr:YihY/virulence factor BrkB family protein [Bifidobacterium aemilianum]RBP98605.1 hypothetical protein CRD60_01810 [Bifidobacterium aemilianum]